MEGKSQTIYRISMGMSVILIIIAGIFDAATLIPLVGTIAGPIFWLITGIYFFIKGMGIMNGRKLAISSLSFVAELIPGVQEIPALVAGIIAILLVIRIEDRTGMSIIQPMKKGLTPPRLKRIPVNLQEGRREPRKKTAVDNNADFPLDAGEIAF